MSRLVDMDLYDLGMRVGRAQNSHVSHIGELQVVHEVPFPCKEARILLSFQSLAYGLIPHFAQFSFFPGRGCLSVRSISVFRALWVKTRARCSRYSEEA